MRKMNIIAIIGNLKFVKNALFEVRPQTNRGPTPVKKSKIKPIGIFT